MCHPLCDAGTNSDQHSGSQARLATGRTTMNDSENLLDRADVLQDGGVLAMAVVDAQGAITAWTAGATRLLGYRPEEVLGRYGADLLIGDLPRAAVQGIERRHDW